MERYGIDGDRGFTFLVRVSSLRNINVRVLAQEAIDGTFRAAAAEDGDGYAG